MALGRTILRLNAASIAIALSIVSGPAHAQSGSMSSQQPTSDAGRPGGPLIPPGKIPPLSGHGVEPLGDNYLGDAPDPTKGGFLTAPGYAPVPRSTERSSEHRPSRDPKGTQLPNSNVIVTLPPATTGRQGLPSQTWSMLTPRQQDLHRQAETAAISSPLGEGFVWADQGRQGEVRVVSDRMFNNRPCRDFAHTVLIDGQRVGGTTTICR